MKKPIKTHGARFAALMLLLLLVAFMPSGAGVSAHKLNAKQLQDSINYYINNTKINYDLIKKRVQ